MRMGWWLLRLTSVVKDIKIDSKRTLNLLAISDALFGDHMTLSIDSSFLFVNTINVCFMLSQVALIHLFAHQFHSCVVVADYKQTWLDIVRRQCIFLSILFFLFSSIDLFAIPEIECLRGSHSNFIVTNAATNLILLKINSYFSFFVCLEYMQFLV